MSEHTEKKERATERAVKRKKIQLKGERPPGVIGEMHPEKALEMIKRWREEGSREEDERIWRQFEPSLRDSTSSYPDEEQI